MKDIETDDVRVIAVVKPEELSVTAVRDIFSPRLDLHVDIRGPYGEVTGTTSTDYEQDKSVFDWHHDCNGEAQYLVVWSNVRPTAVRRIDGLKIVQPKPFELVAINNSTCEHRARPFKALVNRRWFGIVRLSDQWGQL